MLIAEEIKRLLGSPQLDRIIASVMQVDVQQPVTRDDLQPEDRSWVQDGNPPVIAFDGTLTVDSQMAHEQLVEQLKRLRYTPVLRNNPDGDSPHRILAIPGLFEPRGQGSWWIAALLFIGTLVSVLYTGTIIALGELSLTDPLTAMRVSENLLPNLWRGAPYAAAILLILGAHELGHYFMMRRHGTPSTPPYFIPGFGISLFGTFGAVIMLKGHLKNRRTLLDVGAAGPIVGFLFALPILLIGLATSTVTATSGGLVEGDSLLYAAAKIIAIGQYVPSNGEDVLVNQLAWAGWTGMLVTALNLIPLGQLDGGHIVYSMFGGRARRLFVPVILVLLALLVFVSEAWLIFLVLLLLFGRRYAVPLDDITPLDSRRMWVGWCAIAIFVITFTPSPLYIRGESSGLLALVTVVVALLLQVSLSRLSGFVRRPATAHSDMAAQ